MAEYCLAYFRFSVTMAFLVLFVPRDEMANLGEGQGAGSCSASKRGAGVSDGDAIDLDSIP